MLNRKQLLGVFCDVTNRLKKTGFSAEIVDEDWYLGGDIGIDSMDMLEIWYDMEKALKIRIDDSMKRDVYTVKDVLDSLERIQEEALVV